MKPNTLIQSINIINHNKAFQFFIILVIVFSALLIGAKTYDIDPKYITFLGYVDQAITYLFLFEITVRFISVCLNSKALPWSSGQPVSRQ